MITLWPHQTVNFKSNQFSCVLKIIDPHYHHSVLLTGDIEAEAELLMINQSADIGSDVMIVPHHGSRSSSTQSFISAVNPEWAVASLAKGNRWNFPDKNVQSRYVHNGTKWFDTGDYGQISLQFNRGKRLISGQRNTDLPLIYPPWYRQIVRNQLE